MSRCWIRSPWRFSWCCSVSLPRTCARKRREGKRSFSASLETHERLLAAFTQAASAGDLDALVSMLEKMP